MALIALINPDSGSVPADAADRLVGALGERGLACEPVLVNGAGLPQALRRIRALSPEAIIVWGGDGTIAAALNSAGAGGPPVLPLPGGTMNLLHRAVHGAGDWMQCLNSAIEGGRVVDLPAGRCGRRKFYVAAMVGPLTGLATAREKLREGHPMEALKEAVAVHPFDASQRLQVALRRSARGRLEPFAPAAAVGIVPASTGEALEIGLLQPGGPLDLAMTGLWAMVKDWRELKSVSHEVAAGAVIRDVDGHDLSATLDGEPVELPSGVTLSLIPAAARVLTGQAAAR